MIDNGWMINIYVILIFSHFMMFLSFILECCPQKLVENQKWTFSSKRLRTSGLVKHAQQSTKVALRPQGYLQTADVHQCQVTEDVLVSECVPEERQHHVRKCLPADGHRAGPFCLVPNSRLK